MRYQHYITPIGLAINVSWKNVSRTCQCYGKFKLRNFVNKKTIIIFESLDIPKDRWKGLNKTAQAVVHFKLSIADSTILHTSLNMCFSFQLVATDNEGRQKEKEEEEKTEREERDEELQEEGSLKNLTLWSKLAELAVDNGVKGTRESQETVEDSSVVGIEANSPIKSDLHLSDFSVTSSEERIGSVMSPCNSTKDMDCKYLPSNVQSCQSEQSVVAEKETDHQSITEKELPRITNLKSTTNCGIINEVSLEKKEELNSCSTEGSQLNSDTDSENESLFDGLSANLLTRDELLALFKTLYREKQQNTVDCSQKLLITVGLVSKHNNL